MGNISIETIDGVAVISWAGDKLMGDPECLKLQDEVDGLIGKGIDKFVIDFSRVKWSNSTGLGILVSLWNSTYEAGAELVVVIGSDRIENIFRVTNLDKIMESFKTVEEAIRHVTES